MLWWAENLKVWERLFVWFLGVHWSRGRVKLDQQVGRLKAGGCLGKEELVS
jgi:hypothetical protein